MDYEKELMQAMLSRESKTAQSLLERGGNFALIAENVTLFYRALCNSSFGQSLSEDEKLFAVAVIDCWPHIGQGKLPIEEIQHSIPMIKIGNIGTTSYWIPHSDNFLNLKGENNVLISLIMQIEVMIFCAEMLANYKEIVSMVIEMKPLISEMVNCVLHEGDHYELYAFSASYVESFFHNVEFQAIMKNFKCKLLKDKNLSSGKESILFTEDFKELKKSIQHQEQIISEYRSAALNRNLRTRQILVIILLAVFCGLSTLFLGRFVFSQEVKGLDAVCYTLYPGDKSDYSHNTDSKSEYYHNKSCKYNKKTSYKTTVYKAKNRGYFNCPHCTVQGEDKISVKGEYGWVFIVMFALSAGAYILFHIEYVQKKKGQI